MRPYQSFLELKRREFQATGREPGDVHGSLFPFQCAITRWAVRKGRAAIFADCGLGKTRMQLEWARQTGKRVLIVAPLCVAEQTIDEGESIGVSVRKVARPDTDEGITITNYEKLQHFVGVEYDAIVLDESSILKSIDGKTRSLLLNEFTHIPFRLCCTATPAPNDVAEMGNHAQFLGAMKDAEMKAMFFVHDDQQWRLKGHARQAFYQWLASWCVFVRKPSDIGFSDDGFDLPDLRVQEHVVQSDYRPDGYLFAVPTNGIRGRLEARRKTVRPRTERTAELVVPDSDQWLVWCGLNQEGRELKRALGDDCVLIEGADSEDQKIEAVRAWKAGEVRTLISKPRIFGYGMNFQNCHKMAFLGLGDSWEQYYQAIRRTWRFGQTKDVECHIVISEAEEAVADNIQRKEKQAQRVSEEVIRNMGDIEKVEIQGNREAIDIYETDESQDELGRWRLMLGDSIDRIKEVEDGSVGLSVFSPPFAALYTYTDSGRDMGNVRDYDEFFLHFRYLIPELLRVTMPGRRCCVHVQQVSMKKSVDGVIGWRDFRADVVRGFVADGWVYDGEVVVDKDPQAQAIRTKSKSLLFAQLHKDSSWSRPAMADYILSFRHSGENPEPIHPDVDNETWIQWARPIWYGIRETDTLTVAEAREEKDERHICPLQLGTIERCVRLWSNPGDRIFSPFAGIGSEGYEALKLGRKFVGIELKRSYYEVARKNLSSACQPTLFDKAAVLKDHEAEEEDGGSVRAVRAVDLGDRTCG